MPRSSVDYATDNITVYRYCPYGCRYCWAWQLPFFRKRIERGKYDPVDEALRYFAIRERRTIVVSFTSDPYPPEEKDRGLTRRVLEVLSRCRWHRVLVLTKNPKLALRDVDLFKKHGDMWLGTTVISLKRTDWEPNAPPPEERLEALREAHEEGVKTWLSIEPIIPGITYPQLIVAETLDYVDWYVLGAFNYFSRFARNMKKFMLREWYRRHVREAIETLEINGRPYFVKRELRLYLGEANEQPG